jgi:hypothetical protein
MLGHSTPCALSRQLAIAFSFMRAFTAGLMAIGWASAVTRREGSASDQMDKDEDQGLSVLATRKPRVSNWTTSTALFNHLVGAEQE